MQDTGRRAAQRAAGELIKAGGTATGSLRKQANKANKVAPQGKGDEVQGATSTRGANLHNKELTEQEEEMYLTNETSSCVITNPR